MTKKQNSKQYDLEDRTLMYAKNVRAFVKKLRVTIANIEDGKQLISVTSVDVTDPSSASKTAPKYAEQVAQALQKRQSKTK